jgi:hypothetical protein
MHVQNLSIAHQSKLSERNANVQRILDELNMPKFSSTKNKIKGKGKLVFFKAKEMINKD